VDHAEVVASVLQPHFDAVRDEFCRFVPEGSRGALVRLKKTRFLIEASARDSKRHFAGTSEDGRLMIFAPEIVDLSIENLVAIVAHEFGHAADFLYPGAWTWPRSSSGTAMWVGEEPGDKARAWRAVFGKARAESRSPSDDVAPAANWMAAWSRRSSDQVEWAADGITERVTGVRPLYCGPCLIQCWQGGAPRPAGLR
jgi:hypothetical protein